MHASCTNRSGTCGQSGSLSTAESAPRDRLAKREPVMSTSEKMPALGYLPWTTQATLRLLSGSEDISFIDYHIRRTTVTALVHAFLPLGYYIGLALFAPELNLLAVWELTPFFQAVFSICLGLPLTVLLFALYWHYDNWSNHPIAQQLVQLSNGGSWKAVASAVNTEFRRIDKFASGTPGRRFQSATTAQYLNINVQRVERYLSDFKIRLNSLEYSDLRTKLQAQIQNARNIVVRQSLSDQFLEAFHHTVSQNPVFHPQPHVELDQCIGCMQKESNVKLQKHCEDEVQGQEGQADPAGPTCVQCFCRPMWCLECMGKWFASRQDQQRPDTWLSGKAPCPTCRAVFCMLDVCRIVPR
ncbi:hypothetical protein BaRGS_00029467 [Batillaria attramentaria]|uniref:RING-type domain-containing protein n=1 Tax=Batillaria attramentaria TaxID=370345 RepID=A0ABD0JX94_9CAEN